MNTRVSQFELRPSLEPDSNRAQSFPWRTERSFATGSTSPLAANASLKSSWPASEAVLPKPEKLSSRIPFNLIGLLLTATASAKLWMLADVRVGLPKELLWLSVAFELWLAWQNFRVRDQRLLAFVNVVVFASFGVFATTRWMLGYRSCGCSGSLELPGWLFMLIDFAIVAWFALSESRRDRLAAGFRQLQHNWSACSLSIRGRWTGFGLLASLIILLQFPSPRRCAR